VNGIFDLTTRRAVLAFQRDYGIAQTGVVGPTTQSFLVRAVPEFQPVAVSQVPNWFAPQGRPLNVAPQPNLLPPQGRPTVISEVYDGIVPPGRPTLIPEVSDGVVSQGRPLNPSPLTPISPVATYRSVVSVGDTGFEVRKVQQRLRELNYYRGPINGFFDRTTEDAVVRFQRANGITQTGVIGPTTRIYMFNSAQASGSTSTADASPSVASPPTQTVQTLPSTPTLKTENPPISTASVQELQKRLQVQGLYQGPIDGVYNSQMEVAVSKAQELYGSSANDVLFGGLESR
jgi:peptidoglycan hydrolase-like protein with peptidoglycan-binding domain